MMERMPEMAGPDTTLKQPKSLIMIPNSEPSRAKTAQMPKPCILIKKFHF